jgi:hypothetical protein
LFNLHPNKKDRCWIFEFCSIKKSKQDVFSSTELTSFLLVFFFVRTLEKYTYLILVLIASMISPPEFISHISVSIPLILLYEISILLSKRVYRRKQKQMLALNDDVKPNTLIL